MEITREQYRELFASLANGESIILAELNNPALMVLEAKLYIDETPYCDLEFSNDYTQLVKRTGIIELI